MMKLYLNQKIKEASRVGLVGINMQKNLKRSVLHVGVQNAFHVILFGLKVHLKKLKCTWLLSVRKLNLQLEIFFLQRLAAKAINQNLTSTETNVNKKRKSNATISGQQKITEFGKSIDNQIDHALVKAFVICRIPWHIIENPFFIELIKLLRSSYQPPS